MDHRQMTATPENLRSFGKGLGIILAVFAALAWRKGAPSLPWIAGASVLSVALSIAAPSAFKLPFALWMPIASVLAKVNLWLILGLIYYGVLTPYGVLMRIFGKDMLEEGWSQAPTYWVPREDAGGAERHERMF